MLYDSSWVFGSDLSFILKPRDICETIAFWAYAVLLNSPLPDPIPTVTYEILRYLQTQRVLSIQGQTTLQQASFSYCSLESGQLATGKTMKCVHGTTRYL